MTDKLIPLDNPTVNPFDNSCVECQANWLESFVCGCKHKVMLDLDPMILTAGLYCESCGVVPIHNPGQRYCENCVEDIMRWLWNDDNMYLMQIEAFEEDQQYSKEANNG